MVSSESEAEDSISDSLSGKIKQIQLELRALREIKAIVGEARQEIHSLKETVTKLKAENESIKMQLLDQETRSRRGDQLFYGIAQSENEETNKKVKTSSLKNWISRRTKLTRSLFNAHTDWAGGHRTENRGQSSLR